MDICTSNVCRESEKGKYMTERYRSQSSAHRSQTRPKAGSHTDKSSSCLSSASLTAVGPAGTTAGGTTGAMGAASCETFLSKTTLINGCGDAVSKSHRLHTEEGRKRTTSITFSVHRQDRWREQMLL